MSNRNKVRVLGWKFNEEARPLVLLGLIRDHYQPGLAPAKAVLDRFVESGFVDIEFSDERAAEGFVAASKAVGIDARLLC